MEVCQKLNLAPGPVLVTVQPVLTTEAQRGLVEIMDEIRLRQQARGYQGRSLQEMQAEKATCREEDDAYEQRIRDLWSPALIGAPRENP